MNFHTVAKYVKERMDPQRFMVLKLSAFPTMVNTIIKCQGIKSDREVLEEIHQLAKKFERQIEETGFQL
jgi:hypothetical protein